jgi:hypothetical protein
VTVIRPRVTLAVGGIFVMPLIGQVGETVTGVANRPGGIVKLGSSYGRVRCNAHPPAFFKRDRRAKAGGVENGWLRGLDSVLSRTWMRAPVEESRQRRPGWMRGRLGKALHG